MQNRIFIKRNQNSFSFKLLEDAIDKASNIVLLRGNNSYPRSGANILIDRLLDSIKLTTIIIEDSNPRLSKLTEFLVTIDNSCDLIIAVGGGTVMDYAKLVKAFLSTSDIEKRIIGKSPLIINNIPLCVIPTIFGSGSESTQFAVLYINDTKYSISHPKLLPNFAILVPNFASSIKPKNKVCALLDAYCQAIESFWARSGNEQSEKYARSALIILENAIYNYSISDQKFDELLALGANYAGRAINISRTTVAHALSYYLTARYDIKHGHAVSLTIASLFKMNYDKVSQLENIERKTYLDDKFSKLMKILKINKPEDFKEKIIKIQKLANLEISLSELEIHKSVINDIVLRVNVERLGNNPVDLNEKDLELILKDASNH